MNTVPRDKLTGRRSLLRRGLVATAAIGAAGATALRSPREGAAVVGMMQYGASNDAGGDPTELLAAIAAPGATLHVANRRNGYAIDAGGGVAGGVLGASDGGPGIIGMGMGSRGVGVRASSNYIALDVEGRNVFSQAGVVVVGEGLTAKTVGDLAVSRDAVVLATVQAGAGTAQVTAAKRWSETQIRIFLSGPAPAGGLKVGYFVVN